jgi:hypothetical protein
MAGTYSAVVKGSYGTLPRGFPWIFLLWYAGMAAAYGFGAGFGFTSPASVAAFAAFTVGAILVTYIVGNAKPRAFAADAEGIWLGVRRKEPWQDRRKRAHIPWAQIQEIRISPTPAGSAVDIVLSALSPHSRPRVRPAAAACALALMPTSTYLQRPAILEPLTDPLRYHAPLFGLGSSEAAAALRALAPDSVPVTETSAPSSARSA